MDNQHRKISGYRELSQEEIDLMNEIKAKGRELEELLEKARAFDARDADIICVESVVYEAARWRAIARTHLQEGLMALTRSVAKPEFF